MAKPPEEHDHFTVQIERVPKDVMGDLLGATAKLNLPHVKYQLVTDVLKYKQRGQHEVPLADLIDEWSKTHPHFTSREATAFTREQGRGNAGAYYALQKLVSEGVLRKHGTDYARTDTPAIEGPKKAAKSAKPAKQKMQRDFFEVNHREFILRAMRRNHGRITGATIRKMFEADGRKATAISGALGFMMTNKMIKGEGDGVYTLLVKGGAKAKSKPAPAAPKKANGNGSNIQQPAESVTNG